MDSLLPFVLSLIFLCQAIDGAMALPIHVTRASIAHLEAPRVTLEVGIYSIFMTAILFSIFGAYMMAVVDGARTPAFMIRLPRGATLHQTIYRLPSILLALDSRATQRRIPVRRGRISAPMATVPRRWVPRAAHPTPLPLP